MPETQYGLGVVWGISTTGYTKAGTAWTIHTTEQTYAKSADIEETRTELGDYANVCIYGGTETLTLRVYPTGATLAAARTTNVLPLIGDVMLVTDVEDTDIGQDATGKQWVVTECSKARSGTTHVSFDVSLKRWAGITSYTPVA